MPKRVSTPLATLIEGARLTALDRYRTLSPADLASLSRVSSEVAHSLSATQAAVTFVDSTRVWFGGAFGFAAHDAPRENSFCDAVVRGGRPILVPNGLLDPRFRHHEAVRAEPGLRSYAGVPLTDRDDYTLGTVAVFSVVPERFSAPVLDRLAELAALVREFLAEARSETPVRTVQGWLGVKAIATKVNEPGRRAGLLVVSVARGSPAEAAGLRPTDLLHSIDGAAMTALSDIAAAMAGRPAASVVTVVYRRSGQWHSCPVQIRAQARHARAR